MSSYHYSKIVDMSFDDAVLLQSEPFNDIIFACSRKSI